MATSLRNPLPMIPLRMTRMLPRDRRSIFHRRCYTSVRFRYRLNDSNLIIKIFPCDLVRSYMSLGFLISKMRRVNRSGKEGCGGVRVVISATCERIGK